MSAMGRKRTLRRARPNFEQALLSDREMRPAWHQLLAHKQNPPEVWGGSGVEHSGGRERCKRTRRAVANLDQSAGIWLRCCLRIQGGPGAFPDAPGPS